MDRTLFIQINGDVLIKRARDSRTCLEWVRDMGYTEGQWESAIRGYVVEDRVQFYTGKDYHAIGYIPSDVLNVLVDYHVSVYGHEPRCIYNGVIKGGPGELWPPIFSIPLCRNWRRQKC